jgi:LCP family protein required for cell wall assembly
MTVPERRPRIGLRVRLFGGAFAIALCTTIAVAALAIGAVSTIAADISLPGHQVRSPYLKPAPPSGAETILVVGDDHSGTFVKSCNCHLLHADTFMLVHMDPNQGETSMMSIPRDLVVNFTWKGGHYYQQKFNATYSVGSENGGGPAGADKLVLKVASQTLPGLNINHVIDINFSAFIGVVRAIGCVYVDVDHRYLNNLDPSYQPINLQPGYQRLCAEPALSYVRYRHLDSDFVRVARQQDFIRQAKEQLGLFDLATKADQIARAFGKAIRTDIHGATEVGQLLQLIAFSQSRPIRQVPFQYSDAAAPINGELAVTSTPRLIRQSIDDFLNIPPPASAPPSSTTSTSTSTTQHHHHHHHHHTATAATAPGLGPLTVGVESQALTLAPDVPFAVYLPRMQQVSAAPNDFHPYAVRDEQGHLHYGYRVDWYLGTAGEYYGIEGVNWTDPPLFANPSATKTINGRTYMFVDDPPHFHDIGWRVGNALYWVSNTLNETLSNAQMLALAESAHAITRAG